MNRGERRGDAEKNRQDARDAEKTEKAGNRRWTRMNAEGPHG